MRNADLLSFKNTKFQTPNTFRRIEHSLVAVILSMSMLMLFNFSVSAQGRGKRGPVNNEVRLSRAQAYWTQQLSLTAMQQGQFKSVLQQHFAKQDSLRKKLRGNRQAMHGQMIAVRNTTHARLTQILTPEQQKKFVSLWGQTGGIMNTRNWNK